MQYGPGPSSRGSVGRGLGRLADSEGSLGEGGSLGQEGPYSLGWGGAELNTRTQACGPTAGVLRVEGS